MVMASSIILHSFCSISPKSYRNQTLNLTHSQFLSSRSLSLPSNIQFKPLRPQKPRHTLVVFAVQSNFVKVLQTAWKVGKDGIEAGTAFVPDSVPRPIAKVSVTFVMLAISLFVLKSFLSTAFFMLATIGLVYFIFIALNKDEGPRGGGGGGGGTTSGEDSLEEARRIMEKYK